MRPMFFAGYRFRQFFYFSPFIPFSPDFYFKFHHGTALAGQISEIIWKVEHRARYAQGNAEKVENKHIEKPIFRHNVAV